jgi:hypothetical protein
MRRAAIAVVAVLGIARAARGEPDPKRAVTVLEYRAGSSALTGIANRVVGAVGKQTSLRVLGPDQTRAIYGDHLEQNIVRCAGEAECVAKIGAKVGVVEVILVGVSELGDVILTMQRIDVGRREVVTRVADSLASGAEPTDDALAQYLARLLPPTDFVRFGIIQIIAREAGATVTVGGERRGLTPVAPLKLRAPATYDIRVDKSGFRPFTAQVKLPPDVELKLPVKLERPGGRAWYQHWYVVAGLGLVITGAAAGTIYYVNTTMTSSVVGVSGNIH